jgi:hypothetical protein
MLYEHLGSIQTAPGCCSEDISVALAPDGTGGAFGFTVCDIAVPGSLGPFGLRAVGPTGTRSQLVQNNDPRAWIGALGIWPEAVLVPSGSKHCTVLWGKNQSVRGLVARWQKRQSCSSELVFQFFLFRQEQPGHGTGWTQRSDCRVDHARRRRKNNQVQIQRLDVNGASLWGANGATFGAVTGQTYGLPQAWVQLVSNGGGGAIVVMPEESAGATRYMAQAIDANGAITSFIDDPSQTFPSTRAVTLRPTM